ncbi:MAG: sulfate adenylyltransferase subunit CysN [Lentilitoribacter sp.]
MSIAEKISQAELQSEIQSAARPAAKNSIPLRFITCGSVDDGKSTLIGRLLWDTKAVFDDQMGAIEKLSDKHENGVGSLEFANLLDGLQAEQEQGITIDVAYRYFSTPNRSFIVADTPGHAQYTKNMVTGASTADLAVLLIDARSGILEQTRRHANVVSLLGIKQVILVINKIDLIDYDQTRFDEISEQFKTLAEAFNFTSITTIPTSAIKGENVAFSARENMPWYEGKTLLETLELAPKSTPRSMGFRFPVQRISRPDESFRGYQGTIAAGSIKPGDPVTILPSGQQANVSKIVTFDLVRNAGVHGDAVTLVLDRQIDISRGDMIVSNDDQPSLEFSYQAQIIALTEHGIQPGKQYWLKSNTRKQYVSVDVAETLNLETGLWETAEKIELNDLSKVQLNFTNRIAFDTYQNNKTTGSFILIDPDTNNTIAGGMITQAIDNVKSITPNTPKASTTITMPSDIAEEFYRSEFYQKYQDSIESNDS